MSVAAKDLWTLIDQRCIDPQEFVEAVEDKVAADDLDYRTKLLIRDGVSALTLHWGQDRVSTWLAASPYGGSIESICREEYERPGFPFLKDQIMEPTDPATIRRLLYDLGGSLRKPIQVALGGSGSLILKGYLSRKTQDIDFVDEVPKEIREMGSRLKEIEKTHRLDVTHFQSHYLPSGWSKRLSTMESFGNLRVSLVDPYDVFLSKLSSIRVKDRQDLIDLKAKLDKETLARRIRETMESTLASAELRSRCEHNWKMLFEEPLPS